MDKKTLIEKNKLDLAYHRNAQILNAVLIFGTTGILSFIGTFIWKPELLKEGLFIATVILTVSLILYNRFNNKLKMISKKMDGLK